MRRAKGRGRRTRPNEAGFNTVAVAKTPQERHLFSLPGVATSRFPQIFPIRGPARSVLAGWQMSVLEPANDDHPVNPCILVVDDEPTLRRLMRRALVGAGLEVVEAANGLEALERLRDHDVVAVVSDVRMPVMDGLELLQHLRQMAPEVPVVLVSGSEEVGTRATAQALGAFDFLPKPFKLFDLGCAVLGAIAAHPRVPRRRVA